MTTNRDLNEPVNVELTRAEVVVLEGVVDSVTDGLLADKRIDSAQAQALWNLSCAIEKASSDSFSPDYEQVLTEAKKLLSGENQ